VYDRDGRFLRSLGRRGNESIFHFPSAIAIDQAGERLYLIDALRNTLFVLDLAGNVIRRIGTHHENGNPSEFDVPTAIVLAGSELVILDRSGQRIQFLDQDGRLLGKFDTGVLAREGPTSEMGLAVDSEGNIYISNVGDSTVRVYDHSGHRMGAFGVSGMDLGEFLSPRGLWIDSTNRLFVADTNNRRIQVFRVGGSAHHSQPGE
jgi:DNA-binding beta-propeller fold protein YncE